MKKLINKSLLQCCKPSNIQTVSSPDLVISESYSSIQEKANNNLSVTDEASEECNSPSKCNSSSSDFKELAERNLTNDSLSSIDVEYEVNSMINGLVIRATQLSHQASKTICFNQGKLPINRNLSKMGRFYYKPPGNERVNTLLVNYSNEKGTKIRHVGINFISELDCKIDYVSLDEEIYLLSYSSKMFLDIYYEVDMYLFNTDVEVSRIQFFCTERIWEIPFCIISINDLRIPKYFKVDFVIENQVLNQAISKIIKSSSSLLIKINFIPQKSTDKIKLTLKKTNELHNRIVDLKMKTLPTANYNNEYQNFLARWKMRKEKSQSVIKRIYFEKKLFFQSDLETIKKSNKQLECTLSTISTSSYLAIVNNVKHDLLNRILNISVQHIIKLFESFEHILNGMNVKYFSKNAIDIIENNNHIRLKKTRKHKIDRDRQLDNPISDNTVKDIKSDVAFQ